MLTFIVLLCAIFIIVAVGLIIAIIAGWNILWWLIDIAICVMLIRLIIKIIKRLVKK